MIRPAYWTDADLHTRLSAEVREFYVGLWMEADDGGYVAWDVDRIGADLYPYRPLRWRRERLPKWLDLLGAHASLLPCGKHVLIPTLPKYQHCPKPAFPHRTAHLSCVSHVAPQGTTGYPVVPAQEGKGIEGKGIEGGRPGANGASTERMPSVRETLTAMGLPQVPTLVPLVLSAPHPAPKPMRAKPSRGGAA